MKYFKLNVNSKFLDGNILTGTKFWARDNLGI